MRLPSGCPSKGVSSRPGASLCNFTQKTVWTGAGVVGSAMEPVYRAEEIDRPREGAQLLALAHGQQQVRFVLTPFVSDAEIQRLDTGACIVGGFQVFL